MGSVIYPRPIRSIHQIELSTFCNLRCKYCPHPQQEKLRGQPAMHMERHVFKRALDWVEALNDRRADYLGEISLTGVGESLLHPDFVEYVALTRLRMPANRLVFSTNGLLLTEELCAQLAPYRPRIYVSLHRPEKAGPAIQAAKKYGLLEECNPAPAMAAMDWAGQVKGWFVSAPPVTCEYLRSGWGVVLVDGRITTCCLDASGKGVVGHVDDPIESLTVPGTGLKPWGDEATGCRACHMVQP